jgi:hypothetical protein
LLLVCLTLLLFTYSHLILPEYVNHFRRSYQFRRKVVKLRRYWVGKRIALEVEKIAKKRFNNFLILTILAMVFIFSLVHFENKGKDKAKKVLEQHIQNINDPNKMIKVPFIEATRALRFLGCGAKNCVGIENETNEIFYFPHSLGYSFVHEPKT